MNNVATKNTISIPKKEYDSLRQYHSAYIKIAEEMAKAERAYPYDYKYIDTVMRRANLDYKNGKAIEAKSIDQALKKFRKNHSIYRKKWYQSTGLTYGVVYLF